MISMPSSSLPVTTGAHPDPSAASPATPAPAASDAAAHVASGDALAQFGAMHGLHPAVQQFAYAGPNGGSGGAAKSHGAAGAKSVGRAPAPPPPQIKASYDVGSTTPAEIAQLRRVAARTGNDKLSQLANTIENAKAGYGDLLAKGARIAVTTSAGNGGHPVMTVVGPGFDSNKAARIHTHYHGDNATVADPLGSKAGTNARIRSAITRDPQTVFVLPEASNAPRATDSPRHNGDYSVKWGNVKNQAQTTDDALRAAGVTNVGKQIVSFHSGGGVIVRELLKLDPTGALLRADRLEMHDSLYGDPKHNWKKGPDPIGWEKAVVEWSRTPSGQHASFAYFHGNNLQQRVQVLVDGLGARLRKFEMADLMPVADHNNPVAHDSDGKAVGNPRAPAREYNPHPHYRTAGQFLGAMPGP